MNADFGDRVKGGQLLATIEVPELADELNKAKAIAARAESGFYECAFDLYAHCGCQQRASESCRAAGCGQCGRERLDRPGRDHAAEADVGRYRTMTGYTNITAPFDGVVTHRYLDPGALVEDRSDVLRVSDNYRLRLDFPVSVKYVKDIMLAILWMWTLNPSAKKFSGKITRASWAREWTTRAR